MAITNYLNDKHRKGFAQQVFTDRWLPHCISFSTIFVIKKWLQIFWSHQSI